MDTLKRLIPLICATVVLLGIYWWYAWQKEKPGEIPGTSDPAVMEPSTVPTEQPTTVPTATPTTEPTVPVLPVEQWLVEPEYPSYEELFSQDVRYSDYDYDWMLEQNGKYYSYWCVVDENPRVCGGPLDLKYPSPNGEKLMEEYGELGCFGCDGKYAYLCDTSGSGIPDALTTILLLELETGETEILAREERLEAVPELRAKCVIYYVRTSGQETEVCRMYVPDRQVDVLCKVEDPELVEAYTFPETSQGIVSWYGMSTQIVEKAEALWADPNAQKVYNHRDYTYIWENVAKGVTPPESISPYSMFFEALEAETGILALEQTEFDPVTGTYTEKPGTLDGCWLGSGYAHDHFNLIYDPLPAPVALMKPWKPAPGWEIRGVCVERELEWSHGPRSHRIPGREHRQIFWYEDDTVTLILDKPWEVIDRSSKAIYCLAEGNTIMEVSLDGTVCNTLYVSTEQLADPCYGEGMICFKEGDRIMLLDIEKGQYRVAIEDPILEVGYWMPNADWILLSHARGLYAQQYKFYPETGVLERTRIL